MMIVDSPFEIKDTRTQGWPISNMDALKHVLKDCFILNKIYSD